MAASSPKHGPAAARTRARIKYKHAASLIAGKRGDPKKGGAGGRHVWGRPGDEAKFVDDAVDPGDPNYDSLEEGEYQLVEAAPPPLPEARERFVSATRALRAFKAAVSKAVDEYFASGDADEFSAIIAEQRAPQFHHEIPKIAVAYTLGRADAADSQRRVFGLLAHVAARGDVKRHHFASGFRQLFFRLGDLVLDVPAAPELLADAARRAVALNLLDKEAADELIDGAKLALDARAAAASKAAIRAALDEFLASADVAAAGAALSEAAPPAFRCEAVKQAVLLAFDRTPRERELTSFLIASLARTVLPVAEIEKGFELLLQRVEDIHNDVPDVLHLLACFIARAVVDEALPPVFVQHVHVDEGDMGFAVLEHVELLLSQRLAAARLAKVWGAGAAGTVAALKRAIKALVRELFASADVAEALRCVRELAAPHFMHELVFRAMVLALDRKEREIALAARLIADARREGVLLHRQLEMGLSRFQSQLEELRMDAPAAPEVYARIASDLRTAGLL